MKLRTSPLNQTVVPQSLLTRLCQSVRTFCPRYHAPSSLLLLSAMMASSSSSSATVPYFVDPFHPAAVELRTRFGLVFEPGEDGKGHLMQLQQGGGGRGVQMKPFEFDVFRGDKARNQERYESVGMLADRIVYHLLERQGGLRRVTLEEEEEDGDFFFASPDFENADRLLVLVHGAGVVSAGQWARRIIINDNLEAGTQLPYIARARSLGFSVVVLNTNYGSGKRKGKSAEQHAETVWRDHLSGAVSAGARVALVAHSYGGVVALHLARRFEEQFRGAVFALAMTDSVHGEPSLSELSASTRAHLRRVSVNFVASDRPAGERLGEFGGVEERSAGSDRHEWTSHAAFNRVFELVRQRMEEEEGKKEEL